MREVPVHIFTRHMYVVKVHTLGLYTQYMWQLNMEKVLQQHILTAILLMQHDM